MKILVVNRYLVNLILLLGDWKYSYIAIIFFRITVQSFKGNFQFGSKVQTTMRLIIVWELQMEMYLKIFVFLFSLNAFPTNSCVKI